MITCRMKAQPRGKPKENTTCKEAAPRVVTFKPLAPALGLPSRPLPGLAMANQTQVVTQVVLGHVQSMLEQFQELFEQGLSQREAQVPREWSQSPLHDPCTSEYRIAE